MLKYIGNSSIPGIPARDLSDAEVEKFGKTRLLQSGLYVETKMKHTKYENKALAPARENKGEE